MAAIKMSNRGVTTGAVDAAARNTLRDNHLDRYFVHRTGHGLGLEVHESPYIVEGGTEKLRAGMVYTVEPGVYIPSKRGIRIEDDLLVTEREPTILTTELPKEYGWWK
jgi:Xaa-Pro aminopeptidase